MLSVAGAMGIGVTNGRGRRLPREAERLRLALHERSRRRMSDRWGFTADATDALERARALHQALPDDVDRLVLLASVLSTRGDDGAAAEYARRALDLAPDSSRAQSTAAVMESLRGNGHAALVHADRAVALDADDPTAVFNRGALRWAGGDQRAARGDFAAAHRLLGLPPVQPRWRRWVR